MDVFIHSDYQLFYDNDPEKYLENLEYNPIIDIIENNNAVFVITRFDAGVTMPSFRGHSFSAERPYWVNTPPSEIEGFITGVGYSGRLSSHRDMVVRSYERAVISIIRHYESVLQGEHQIYQDTGVFGFESSFSGETRFQGALENFYVVESWTDLSNLSVWTLAVAKKGN